MCLFKKEVSGMYFTKGRLIEYERMMKETPGFDHRPVKTMKERDCENCLHFDEKLGKCSLKKCVIFED